MDDELLGDELFVSPGTDITPLDETNADLDCKKTLENRGSDTSRTQSVSSVLTNPFEMEPFLEYLPKIEQVLRQTGLEGFQVEPVQHGPEWHNCVYRLQSPQIGQQNYILRVPRRPAFRESDGQCAAIENDVVLLRFLADQLAVPRIKAYSATTDNALNTPYTVQTKLAGVSLNHVYRDLTYEERLPIIDEFVELMVKIEDVMFHKAGHLAAPAPPYAAAGLNASVTAVPVINLFGKSVQELSNDPQTIEDREGFDLKAFLISYLNSWIEKETIREETSEYDSPILPSLRELLVILDDLEREGAFRGAPNPIVLHHWDLEPRNIMVQHVNDKWRITGIIDWDGALALPRPLARQPPEWIWDFDTRPPYTRYLNNDHYSHEHLSIQGKALKAHFDMKAADALPQYLEDAYGMGKWLRRIWTFAKGGPNSNWYIDLIRKLPSDWKARKI
ncbi:MAG: hypothetical protein Q9219_006592 [cf. Caloplaca sp. 3 TL-2023]